jgi:copper chaperone NosL
MLKVFIGAIVFFILVGCSSQKSMQIPSTMFQSVNESQAVLIQDGKEKRYCHMCGMDLVKYYKTSHSAEENGKNYQYCSLHCLEEHFEQGIILKNPKVVDVTSLKFVDASKAFYVVGSKKRGTMSKSSKYAFLNKNDAKAFQAEFDGEIMDFNGALDKAKEDFKYNN